MAASADSSEKPWGFSPPLSIVLTWAATARWLYSTSPQMWAVGEGKALGQGFPRQLRLSCRGCPLCLPQPSQQVPH